MSLTLLTNFSQPICFRHLITRLTCSSGAKQNLISLSTPLMQRSTTSSNKINLPLQKPSRKPSDLLALVLTPVIYLCSSKMVPTFSKTKCSDAMTVTSSAYVVTAYLCPSSKDFPASEQNTLEANFDLNPLYDVSYQVETVVDISLRNCARLCFSDHAT